MMEIIRDVCIRGIATAVPKQVEENMDAIDFLGERRCKKQIKLTGIERRHVSPEGQKVSDLCFEAGEKLLESLCWKPKEIKVIVLLTQYPDFAAPSTAFLLQKMLNIPNDCIVFDVNLGCSAFNVGFQIVAGLLQQFSGNAKGLCFQCDLAYKACRIGKDPDILANDILFGSAGSAVAIEKGNGFGNSPVATFSDGKRYNTIMRSKNQSVNMDGSSIFNFSVSDVSKAVNYFRIKYNLSDDKIDYYVFHQAQKLILDNLAIECGIPEGRELRSITDYGNTSGASIPLSICVNRELFTDKKTINVLSCGFGVGLSWSMAYTVLNTDSILPVIYTDKIL